MIEVRLAKVADAQIIALLGRITFIEAFGHLFQNKKDLLDYLDKTFGVTKIHKGILKPNNKFWIAFHDKLPVGYVKLKLNSKSGFSASNKQSQLQKIYVLNSHHSMKIGFSLQEKAIEMAKELGYLKLWLSVWTGNKRAINFYKRGDFSEIGIHTYKIGQEVFEFIAMMKSI